MSQLFHWFSCKGLHAAAVPPPTVAKAFCLHSVELQSNVWLALSMLRTFRLRAHTLTVETASWKDGISPVCDRCSCGQIQDEAHVLFMCRYEELCALRQKHSELFWTLSGDFSPAHPFLQHQLSVQAVSNFLLQRNKKLFYFLSELMDVLLAGMDQPQADQPNSLDEGLPVQSNPTFKRDTHKFFLFCA
eukprot:1161106-Pelagomonas_calceolata.AAC.13